MYRTNAVSRAPGELMKGSAAMKGAARIRPAVMVLGRFTGGFSAPLGERLKHQLTHGLERIEHAISLDSDCLEIWRALHPFSAWKLFDEVLTRVVGVRRDATLARLLDFPARIESSLQIVDWSCVRQVALVVLDHERHLREIVPVFGHVVVEILHRLEIRFHALRLRVANED